MLEPHVSGAGAGGAGPPGVGLGNAWELGMVPGVTLAPGLADAVGELDTWPMAPGSSLQADAAKSSDARIAVLT